MALPVTQAKANGVDIELADSLPATVILLTAKGVMIQRQVRARYGVSMHI
jgi:hypothetical protein